MKTIKRTLSAALIACLLLSLLVPTALAATTIAQKVIEYYFKDYCPVVFGTTSNIALGQKEDDGSVPNDNYNTAIEAYGNNNINSACMYWSSGYVSSSGNPAVPTALDKGISLVAYVGDWLAFKIKSPGVGEFKVGVRPFSDSSAPQGLDVYILPFDNENPITKDQIPAALENATAVGNVNVKSTSSKKAAGNFVFEDGYDDFLVVFKSTKGKDGGTGETERADYKLAGLQLIRTCTDAVDAAKEISNAPLGSTITLQDDCNAAGKNITVGAGVTLNLNGKTLTASSVTGFKGSIVTDSGDAAATLKVDELKLQKDDTYIPLYDTANGCYKLYNYTLQSLTPESNKYWFRLTFTNSAAYDLIASGTSGLEIGVDMSWTVGSVAGGTYAGAKANDFDYSGWANAVKTESKVAISVTVTGIELVDAGSFELVPTITSSAVDAA